ncbi:hypothetical protein [Magnetofaba australis]|uniref:HEPN domain-containing protein n=1 Tax=Magnetofaba australis IT-1 TaxID=1434232 RepID=A0A1Y2KAC5_9PROT|nr:hypothetical protein [Magnetofaba australis]OSM06755.1 hypothetical protein MAIT1_00388 [Magnetofaba australis IT-1]
MSAPTTPATTKSVRAKLDHCQRALKAFDLLQGLSPDLENLSYASLEAKNAAKECLLQAAEMVDKLPLNHGSAIHP